MKKILGVYHLACMNHYIDIFCEQFNLLHSSGLYRRCNKILIYISLYNNDLILDSKLKEYDPDNKFLIFKDITNTREKFAINDFRNHIEDEAHMIYFHSKSVSHTQKNNMKIFHKKQSWREILNFYTISKWKISLELLKQYDAVGCFLTRWPTYHFSGNFWWANIEYVKNIPNCEDFYLAPEIFIGEHFKNNFINLTEGKEFIVDLHSRRTDEDILNNINVNFIDNEHFWYHKPDIFLVEHYKKTKYWEDFYETRRT